MKIPARVVSLEGTACLELHGHGFSGRILIDHHTFSETGNPVIPGLGEVSFDQEVFVTISPSDWETPAWDIAEDESNRSMSRIVKVEGCEEICGLIFTAEAIAITAKHNEGLPYEVKPGPDAPASM